MPSQRRSTISPRDKERGARAVGAAAMCFITEPFIWGQFVSYMNREFPNTGVTQLVSQGVLSQYVVMQLSMVLAETMPDEDDSMTTTQDDYDQERPTTL